MCVYTSSVEKQHTGLSNEIITIITIIIIIRIAGILHSQQPGPRAKSWSLLLFVDFGKGEKGGVRFNTQDRNSCIVHYT